MSPKQTSNTWRENQSITRTIIRNNLSDNFDIIENKKSCKSHNTISWETTSFIHSLIYHLPIPPSNKNGFFFNFTHKPSIPLSLRFLSFIFPSHFILHTYFRHHITLKFQSLHWFSLGLTWGLLWSSIFFVYIWFSLARLCSFDHIRIHWYFYRVLIDVCSTYLNLVKFSMALQEY